MIFGDFNLKEIIWEENQVKTNDNHLASRFYETTQDLYNKRDIAKMNDIFRNIVQYYRPISWKQRQTDKEAAYKLPKFFLLIFKGGVQDYI